MDAGVTFAIGLGVTLLLTFFTILSTGSVLAVGVLWVLLSMGVYLLYTYGVITADILTSQAAPVTQPVGQAASSLTNTMLGSEVFHVADNQFTYNDAQAVCAAYDSQLATLEQIIDAYNHGAEWCGYGWSAGGMALYPTQKGTWDALQQESDQTKRTACGRPGVNGGYFDPNSKFGVNCYGIKPQGNLKLPTPLPGTDPTAFGDAVAKFKAMIKSFNLDPYSRSVWSGSPVTPVTNTISAGQQFINQVEHVSMRENFPDMEVMPGQTLATTGLPLGSPYGLRGDKGDSGEMGPTGPQGPTGIRGADGTSNIAGPTGPAGIQGHDGAASTVPGPTGAKGDKGDRGEAGRDGAAAAAGATGPAGKDGAPGANGAKGDKGDKGDPFKPGRNGVIQAYDDGSNYGTIFKGDANKPGGFIGMMFDSNNKPWIWMNGPNNSWNGTFDEKNAWRW